MADKNLTTRPELGRGKGKPVAVVKHGSAAVPIYRQDRRGLVRFTVAFYLDGVRQRRTFGNIEEAKEEARMAALNIQRGMSFDNDLQPQEREIFRTVRSMLADSNVSLVSLVDESLRCRRKLGDVTLTAAVDEYVRRHESFKSGMMLAPVINEYVRAKSQDGISRRYMEYLRVLWHFEKIHPGPIDAITTQQINGWVRRGEYSVVTRKNWIVLLKGFFGFARQQGYLPKLEPTAAEPLKVPKNRDNDVGIFKPEEMEKLLRVAKSDLLPLLAIGGFAGLRAAEIERLDWSAVDLNRKIIELRAGQAKTASRRVVPISENLAAWLAPLKKEGPVASSHIAFQRARDLSKKVNIEWPHNALRHSYISYRIAVVQNAAQVALEAGNSPAIIFRHYRELVTKEDAEKWFSIMPTP